MAGERRTGTRGAAIILGVALAIGASCCSAMAVSVGGEADRLDTAGATTQAEVLDGATGRGGRGPVVSFTTRRGERVEAICDSCEDLAVGSPVEIRYDPADLEAHVEQVGRASHRNVSVFAWLVAALATAGLLTLLVRALWRRVRRPRE